MKASDADNRRAGVLLVLGSAALFGALTTLARITYDEGGSAMAVFVARFWFSTAILGVLCYFTGRNVWGWRGGVSTLVVGLGWVGTTVGYLLSVVYIPVSLAAILFYTYPIIVAVGSVLSGSGRPGVSLWLALALAFCGLILAVGPSWNELDWRGVALALFGAVSIASTFLFGAHAVSREDPVTVAFQSNGVGALLVTSILLIHGGLVLPESTLGLMVLMLATLFFAAAVCGQLLSLRRIPPALASMLYNLEPVVSVLLGLVILGEVLGSWQWAGALLVLGAVVFVSLRD